MCVMTCAHCHRWQNDHGVIVYRLLGTLQLFVPRMCYTLEIRHFPRFFHEMNVSEGNATCNTESKHGRLELSKQKRKEVQNSTNYQRMWGENRNIFHAFQSFLIKVARVNKHKWSYFAWLSRNFSLHQIDVVARCVPGLEIFDFFL